MPRPILELAEAELRRRESHERSLEKNRRAIARRPEAGEAGFGLSPDPPFPGSLIALPARIRASPVFLRLYRFECRAVQARRGEYLRGGQVPGLDAEDLAAPGVGRFPGDDKMPAGQAVGGSGGRMDMHCLWR